MVASVCEGSTRRNSANSLSNSGMTKTICQIHARLNASDRITSKMVIVSDGCFGEVSFIRRLLVELVFLQLDGDVEARGFHGLFHEADAGRKPVRGIHHRAAFLEADSHLHGLEPAGRDLDHFL